MNASQIVPVVAAGATAIEIMSGCAPIEPYSTQKVTAEVLDEALRSSFPAANSESKDRWKNAVIEENPLNQTIYRNGDYTATFFTPDNFQIPTKERLDGVWDFLKSRNSLVSNLLGLKIKFNPVSQMTLYAGNFGESGEVPTITVLRNINGSIVTDSLVNLDDVDQIIDGKQFNTNPFWTEFCQTLYFGNRGDVVDQETICNQLGIAVYYIESGVSYEKYKSESPQGKFKILNGKVIFVDPYSEEEYNKLSDIVNKTGDKAPIPSISPISLRRNGKYEIGDKLIADYMKELGDKGILTEKNKKYYQDQALLGNFI